jgi:hypothetical protein
MGCVRRHAEPCAWYHHYHIPRPRRGGFRTRPYGTHIHETRPYETHIHENRPYETHIHENRIHENRIHENRIHGTRIHGTRIHGTRIHGTRIHGTRPYRTTICTQGRMCIFGEILNGVMHLNETGHIVA